MDQGFPRGGFSPKEGVLAYYLARIYRKLLDREGATLPKCYYVDPPLALIATFFLYSELPGKLAPDFNFAVSRVIAVQIFTMHSTSYHRLLSGQGLP